MRECVRSTLIPYRDSTCSMSRGVSRNKYAQTRPDLRGYVDCYHSLRAESRCDGHILTVVFKSPPQYLLCSPAFRRSLGLADLCLLKWRSCAPFCSHFFVHEYLGSASSCA